jgi:hypothetical protein
MSMVSTLPPLSREWQGSHAAQWSMRWNLLAVSVCHGDVRTDKPRTVQVTCVTDALATQRVHVRLCRRNFRNRSRDLPSHSHRHTCIGQNPRRELVVFGVQVRRRHSKHPRQPLRGLNIRHVLPSLILIDPRAGNRRVEARLDAQLLLGDTEPFASLPQTMPDDRNASHPRPTGDP